MNILLITQEDYLAGSTYAVSYLAKGLVSRGHRVVVVARENSLLQKLLSSTSVIFKPLALRGRFNLKQMKILAQIASEEKIHVFNAQSSKDRYLCIFTRWLYRLPLAVFHTRRQYPKSAGGALQRWLYVQGTDKVIVVSNELKRIFTHKGFPERHLKVIHDGIPKDKLGQWSEDKVNKLAEQWGIRPGDIVIGSVSRLKNHSQIIESLVFLDRPEVKVLLVGVKQGQFDILVHNLKIKNQIIYAGEVSGEVVLNYYKLFNVSILPSTMDGFGLVLMESMAMECPVIATNFGGIKDVVQHEYNGLLFEDRHVKQLAHCIQRVLEDDVLKSQLVKNGLTTVMEKFTMEKTISAYEEFFKQNSHQSSE